MTRRRVAVALLVFGVIGALALAQALSGLHGHTVRATYAPNHGRDFDFEHPPCAPGPRPATDDDSVLVRYLGVSGLYVEWRGVALLFGPYFSRVGLIGAGFGRIVQDGPAIARGLDGLALDRVYAVLVGHSHYDHLADVPVVLLEHAHAASVLVNRSGANMLSAFPALGPSVVALEPLDGHWLRLSDRGGAPLPVRVLPLRSGHADHFGGYHFAPGEVAAPWTSWNDKRNADMKEGLPFAFLVDLLDTDGRPAFRLHYQDAASDAPRGFPPEDISAERPVDLAVTCLPSSWRARDYPRGLLERTRARHVLVTHYDDFFQPLDRPLRFVANLTDERAATFLEAVRVEMTLASHEPRGPDPAACGPSSTSWTMPLPGEWLRFRAEPRGTLPRP
jgi:L-ascorbate metabolism protein UlaG (beta-lactamase superfamily)